MEKIADRIVQTQDSLSAEIPLAPRPVVERSLSHDLHKTYTGKEFDYSNLQGESQNIIARLLNWFIRLISDIFGVTLDPDTQRIFHLIIYTILTLLAAYWVLRLLTGRQMSSFFRKEEIKLTPIRIQEEVVENLDFNKLIREALSAKDYRLAIRYSFLRLLQDMSSRNIIDYHSEKTNYDYYQEIKTVSVREEFWRVVHIYEYVWYGKFEVAASDYDQAEKTVTQLSQKLQAIG